MHRVLYRAVLLCACLSAITVAAPARAHDADPGTISYGWNGLWTGAEVGLAAGFLSTGAHYESREWRKLVFGTGVGALVGVGVGLTLGLTDAARDYPPTGWYVLRDTGDGTMLGAFAGAIVGLIALSQSDRPKDVLTGASIGALVGAGAGAVFGLIEGATAHRPAPRAPGCQRGDVHLALLDAPGSLAPIPGVAGSW